MNNSSSAPPVPTPADRDEAAIGTPASFNVSRRGMLTAGTAAGLFAAGGLGLSESRAEAAVPKAAARVPIEKPRGVTCLQLLTPVTPPHNGTTAMNLINSTPAQRIAFNSTAIPFRIDPHRSGAPLPAASDTIATDIADDARDSIGELVGFELISNTSIIVPGTSEWKRTVGAGPSTVLLRLGNPKAAPITIRIAGARLAEIQAAVTRMHTDPSRLDEMLIQQDSPHMYLVYGTGLDQKVMNNPKDLNWTCAAIDAVQSLSAMIVKVLKDRLKVPRPEHVPVPASGWPAHVPPKPIIDMPRFQSYPGGHATVMYALHIVLMDITGASPSQTATFEELTNRIVLNRELAGLHTSVDTQGGKALGTALANALLEVVGDSAYPIWSTICTQARKEWAA